MVLRVAAACAACGQRVVGGYGVPAGGPGRAAGRLVDPAPLLRECGFRLVDERRWLGGFLAGKAWVNTGDAG